MWALQKDSPRFTQRGLSETSAEGPRSPPIAAISVTEHLVFPEGQTEAFLDSKSQVKEHDDLYVPRSHQNPGSNA